MVEYEIFDEKSRLKNRIKELEKQLNSKLNDCTKIKLRPEILWFAEQMEKKLQSNDYKGGWNDCSIKYLLYSLKEEIKELSDELNQKSNSSNIIKEAADIANFAMMIADKCKH